MFKSFFDIEFRLEELDKAGDTLTKLNEVQEPRKLSGIHSGRVANAWILSMRLSLFLE